MREVPDQILRFFATLIQQDLGIVYDKRNSFQLATRLKEVAKALGLPDIEALYQAAQRGLAPNDRRMLHDIATNNETYFFRDPPVFDYLEQEFSTRLQDTGPLRIWSCACSYGQEPYSLAMTMERLRLRAGPSATGLPYQIMATDVSERALTAAEAGCYGQLEIDRGLSTADKSRWFDKHRSSNGTSEWRIKDAVRKNIRFASLNLLAPVYPFGPFEVILCRNVLIYQAIAEKERILGQIFDCLSPGGILILGTAESLIGLRHGFEIEQAGKVTVHRRPKLVATA